MADSAPKLRKVKVKKTETVRERTEKRQGDNKTRRIKRTANKITRPITKPFKYVIRIGRKEYYLKMPNNKVGRFLNKRRSIIPSFVKGAWKELKLVTWPTRKETTKLTIAVFTFAVTFGAIIAITDYGLDKLFRSILIK